MRWSPIVVVAERVPREKDMQSTLMGNWMIGERIRSRGYRIRIGQCQLELDRAREAELA